jgi:hypothetical protein
VKIQAQANNVEGVMNTKTGERPVALAVDDDLQNKVCDFLRTAATLFYRVG